MTVVKPRKSPQSGMREHQHRAAASTERHHGPATGQSSGRKDAEERAALTLFDQAKKLDQVASSTHEADTRDKVREVVSDLLSHAEPVRVTTASKILKLDSKTVRAWAKQGVLTTAQDKPRLMLEAERLYAVATLVHDLRKAGRSRHLLDAVWNRLQDEEFLESDELAESLDQMRLGQGRPWREVRSTLHSTEPEHLADED
ncbi:hypothetical protein ABZT47_34295 [Sphaerisporangium sp. NPDC005289]|uniref:hypothetical protein n=1 Tax=Sphaerisporangium sp. NPDC005289 TaxID=3155247 RepID=UPI0033A57E1E